MPVKPLPGHTVGDTAKVGQGFTGGDSGTWDKIKSRMGATDVAEPLLKQVQQTPMSDQEAVAAAQKLGMKSKNGMLVKHRVGFLLKNFGEKGPDGKWQITREIKPPFWSPQMPAMTEVFKRYLNEAADLKKIKSPEDAIEQAKDLALEVQASAAALYEYMDAQSNDPTSESPAKGQLPALAQKLQAMKAAADEIEKMTGQAEGTVAQAEEAYEEANKGPGKTFGKV